MYSVELDETLCRMISIYRRVGIWRNDGESKCRKSCMRILYFLQYLSFIIYVLTGAYTGYVSGDMNQATFSLNIGMNGSIILVKLFYLLWRMDDILQFLYDPIVTHLTKDYRETVIVNQKIKKVTVFYKCYTLVLSFAVTIVTLIPLPIFTGDAKMLPVFIRFNLESDYERVLYWMAYIWGAIGCVACAVYTLIMLFIWYIMYNYAIEYELLGHRFKAMMSATTSTTPNAFQQELIHLIRVHNNLFKTIEQFRSCFSALFLLHMITGSISICISTYILSYNTTGSVFQMAYNLVFLFYSFFEIFLLMYLANEITINSDRISYCLFESNWIDQSESTKKCLIILCEMVKRTQQLVIVIFPMNLEKFTSIVNCAYSMFNIMKSSK